MQRQSGKHGKQSRAEGREAGRERDEVQAKSINPASEVSATLNVGQKPKLSSKAQALSDGRGWKVASGRKPCWRLWATESQEASGTV